MGATSLATIGWTDHQVYGLSAWESLGQTGSKSVSEAEAFLQQWLFFGILHATFGDMVKLADFTEEVDGRKYVHTRSLIPLARARLVFAESEGLDEIVLQYSWDCVSAAAKVYEAITTMDQNPLEPHFMLSLACTIRFVDWLRTALHRAIKAQLPWPEEIRWADPSVSAPMGHLDAYKDDFERIFGKLGLSKNRMAANGWCPHYLERTITMSLETRWFYSHLPRPDPSKDHSACHASQCVAYQVMKKDYHTMHASSGCKCNTVQVDLEKLEKILRQPGELTPVLIVTIDEETYRPLIDVQPATEIDSYVAISHVWSDGLGNPSKNALPECQVVKLANLVRLLTPASERVVLWIDTLCCPVGSKELRKLSIARMSSTYRGAEKVLVLDNHLRSLKGQEMNPLEICTNILASGWIGRLWTWQEGALSKELHIQFADITVELEPMVDAVRANRNSWKNCFNLDDMMQLYHNIRGVIQGTPPQRFFRLEQLSHALQGRITSVKEDEALCIGAMQGADLMKIQAVGDPNDYMQAFWSCYEHAPRDLVFWRHKRLTRPGFRWAPATFLEGKEDAFRFTAEMSDKPAVPGQVTSRGLRIQCAAILLDVADDRPIFQRVWITGLEAATQHLVLRDPRLVGDRFGTPSCEGPHTRIAILMQNCGEKAPHSGRYAATVVYIVAEEDQTLFARRGDSAMVSADQEQLKEQFEKTFLAKRPSPAMAAGQTSIIGKEVVIRGNYERVLGRWMCADQWWCID